MIELRMKNFTFEFLKPEEVLGILSDESLDSPQTLIQLFCTNTDVKELKNIQNFFADTFPNTVKMQ
jgi:hypothetical protein